MVEVWWRCGGGVARGGVVEVKHEVVWWRCSMRWCGGGVVEV